MKWELFVDESGNFDKDRPCLVGGFLCPEGVMGEQTATAWKNDVKQDPAVREAIGKYGDWNFDHCRENKDTDKIQLRSDVQTAVLRAYREKLNAADGYFVLFDNPSGAYNIDNTTNFLTVLAKGLLMLFYDLQGEMTSLKVHFAARKNVTFHEPAELAVSPTRVQEPGMTDQRTIQPQQYRRQLENIAFLHGGHRLLKNKVFSEMLDTIDIISDRYVQAGEGGDFSLIGGEYVYTAGRGNYKSVPNPLTVPCDYICNTYFSRSGRKAAAASFGPPCRIYPVDQPLSAHAMKDHLTGGASGEAFLQLFSMDFPEPDTTEFFRLYNGSSAAQQKAAVTSAVEGLRDRVDSQREMPLMIERLEHAIEKTESIEDIGQRACLKAHLYLYLHSLYTHLGNQNKVSEIHGAVQKLIDDNDIEDEEDVDKLLSIAATRNLVDLTDRFSYDEAEREFNELQKYWEGRIKSRLRPGTAPRYSAYGKAIGSYLQVLRHRMHETDDREEKEYYYFVAADLFEKYLHHIGTEAGDLSRCHQTICDIEAEMERFDSAFTHLYLASGGTADCPSREEMSVVILRACADDGGRNHYLLQHYARTAALMEACGKREEAEAWVLPYLATVPEEPAGSVANPHPRTQIRWKTASLLAYREAGPQEDKRRAAKLFDSAARELLAENEAIFAAIAVGIRAEQLCHILGKRIPGNPSTARGTLGQAYRKFLELKGQTIDPFTELLDEKGTPRGENESAVCERVAAKIGY